MRTRNDWQQFEATGRVEDYLSYVNNSRKHGEENAGQTGEKPYAGIHICNGNHTETGAYWRI